MTFLHPEFLWGLFALAIPIIVHLFHFRRFKKVDFSNVAFLVNIEKQKENKRKLKYYLILASRLLAISFLVLAFAMPIKQKDKESFKQENKFISIYIDNSLSMGTTGKEGILLEVAKNRARDIVKNFGNTDKFQIVSNDFHVGTSRYTDAEKAIEKIDALEISPSSKPIEDILEWQTNNSKTPSIYRFILSDFQKSISSFTKKDNTNKKTYLIPIPMALSQNMSIDSCWFNTPIFASNENVTLYVKVKNYNDESISENLVTLEVNGQVKSTSTIELNPNSSKTFEIPFKLDKTGYSSGRVYLNTDERSFDDAQFFAFNASEKSKVLVINGADENKYLEKLFSNNPDIQLDIKNLNNIDYSLVPSYNLVVLNECSETSSALLAACDELTKKGGNVLLIPSKKGNNKEFSHFGMGINNLQNSSVRFSNIAVNHPFYAGVFDKKNKQNYDAFASKYYSISGGTSLIGLANGKSFANIKSHQSGSVYAIASPLDLSWSQFPTFDYFVPFMLRASMYGSNKEKLYRIVGDNSYFPIKTTTNIQEKILLQSEKEEFIPETKYSPNGVMIKVDESIKTNGIYSIYNQKNKSKIGLIAFNYNNSESEVNSLNKADLNQLGFPNVLQSSSQKFDSELKEEAKGTPYWKYCIMLTLLLLGLEILIIKLIKT